MYVGNPYVVLMLVRDPMPGVDHSAPWTPSLFQSLEGAYTMWMPSYRPQARKLSWPWLSEAEAKDISTAIRSPQSPGPIACWDPFAQNLLSPAQAGGRGATWLFASEWSAAVFSNAANTTAEGTLNRRVQVGPMGANSKIFWRNPSWPGFPMAKFTTADRSFHFQWANAGFSLGTGGLIGVDALDAAGAVLETISAAATGSSGSVSGSFVTSSVVFARPFVRTGSSTTFTGPFNIGIASFRMGTTVAPTSIFNEGVGCPGYGVQSFSDVYNMWPYRSIQASLVEVVQNADF